LSHVPELRGARSPLTFLLALALVAAANAVMLVADGAGPQGTLATQLVVLLAGFFVAAPFRWAPADLADSGLRTPLYRRSQRDLGKYDLRDVIFVIGIGAL
jgi:hypothetical protein